MCFTFHFHATHPHGAAQQALFPHTDAHCAPLLFLTPTNTQLTPTNTQDVVLALLFAGADTSLKDARGFDVMIEGG